MRGLLAAVMGGASRGAGEIADRQMETNAKKALLEAEEEMRLRLAEAQDRMSIKAEERAETRAISAEERAETRAIAAEERDIANIPKVTSARETPTEKQNREREKDIIDLRNRLAGTEDDAERERLIKQLGDQLGAFGASAKTMSDVVAAGNGYRAMADSLDNKANALLKQVEEAYDDPNTQARLKADAKNARDEADKYRREADRIFKTAFETRTPGASGGSSPAPAPQAPANMPPLESFRR